MTPLLFSCTPNPLGYRRYEFRYSFGMNEDFGDEVYYSDSLFFAPASEYNPTLSTVSLALAMAGFSSNEEAAGSYGNRFQNAVKLLNGLGFEDIEPNDDYRKKPETDTFGAVFAHKELEGKTLLAITVRGGGYLGEWASNFTLGKASDNPYAQGFQEASDIYLSSLRKYVESHSLTGKTVIWAAGYSRGAAVTNLSIGRIDAEIFSGVNTLLPSLSLSKEDIHAYCFEPPAGAYFTAEDEDDYAFKKDPFDNIHCIINLNDPVPLVAPKEFSFCRYGQEHYLSDYLTNLDHASYIKRVISFFDDLDNSDEIGDYLLSSFHKKSFFTHGLLGNDTSKRNWTSGLYLNDFIHRLAIALESRDNYVDTVQQSVRDIFRVVYSSPTVKESLFSIGIAIANKILVLDSENILVSDLLHQPSRLYEDLKPILVQAFKSVGVDFDIDEVVGSLKALVNALANITLSSGGIDVFASLVDINNIKALGQAHRPELCLAHLKAMDPAFGEDHSDTLTDRYYILKADKLSSIRVLAGGKEVAKMEEGKPSEGDYPLSFGVVSDEVFIYLPPNHAYEIKCEKDVAYRLEVHKSNAKNDVVKETYVGEAIISL